MFVVQHWKAILVVLAIGLIVFSVAVAKPNGEPIDTPFGP
jgi:hypothetical protein